MHTAASTQQWPRLKEVAEIIKEIDVVNACEDRKTGNLEGFGNFERVWNVEGFAVRRTFERLSRLTGRQIKDKIVLYLKNTISLLQDNLKILFSKACEYGIRAIVHIAVHSENGLRVGLKEIADAIDSPEAFTAKILQQLSRNDLIVSTKGPSGGFEMSGRQLKEVMLSDVVKTIDNDVVYTGCGLGLAQCDDNAPCPLHDDFIAIREQLRIMLETTSIAHLAQSISSGHAMLKR